MGATITSIDVLVYAWVLMTWLIKVIIATDPTCGGGRGGGGDGGIGSITFK